MEPYDASTTPSEPAAEPTDSAPMAPIERADRAPESEPSAAPERAAEPDAPRSAERENMLPRRGRRRLGIERLLVRLIATAGIIGIGVALGAILVSQKVDGWIVGLVIALVTVILSAILWSSRQL